MKKLIILGIVFLTLISSVSALNFVTGESATLYGTCILTNGTLDGDNMTLTAFYPNASIFINNQNMTNFGVGFYKHSFSIPNITGTYPYSMTCSANSSTFSASDEFEVFDVDAKDFIQVNIDNGANILAIVFAQIFVIAVLIALGTLHSKTGWRFFGYSMAIIQIIIMLGYIYAHELTYDLTTIMRINFIASLFIIFGFGMYTMFRFSVKIGNLGEEKKDGKWGNKDWKDSS